MKTHDFGPAFWQIIRLSKDAPIIHMAPTTEIEHPYRESTSLILRLPFGRGLVIGWWQNSGKDEFEALAAAIHYQVKGYLDDDASDVKSQDADNVFVTHTWTARREDSVNYQKAIQVWDS